MSQHYSYSKNNREVLYGLDAPTGGYFLTEFYNDGELDETIIEETTYSRDGLLLSELEKELKKLEVEYFVDVLLNDFNNYEPPSPMQIAVGRMFGREIQDMMIDVGRDIEENYK